MRSVKLFLIVLGSGFFSLTSCVSMQYGGTRSSLMPVGQTINTKKHTSSTIKKVEVLDLKSETLTNPNAFVEPDLASLETFHKSHKVREALNSFRENRVNEIIHEAESYLGVRYRYGGTTRRGIDCSSFVQKSLKEFLPTFPRVSHAQSRHGERVARKNLKVGDLVYFATRGGRRVSHVGIVHHFDENNRPHFIHASSSQGVSITSLGNRYWSPRYLFAKRILNDKTLRIEEFSFQEQTEKSDSISDYNKEDLASQPKLGNSVTS